MEEIIFILKLAYYPLQHRNIPTNPLMNKKLEEKKKGKGLCF
jgi:hypothetical protein